MRCRVQVVKEIPEPTGGSSGAGTAAATATPSTAGSSGASGDAIGSGMFGTAASAVARTIVPADAYASLTAKTLKHATANWQDGTISNFEYIMALNALAGRSFNDLTQYPVGVAVQASGLRVFDCLYLFHGG